MDAPIYIRFASIDSTSGLPPISMHNQLFVIEESDGKTSAAAGGNELENERVTILNLPDSPFIRSSSVAVAKSCLFIVGGDYRDGSERVVKFNGIQSVNLKDDDSPSWEASPLDEDRPAAFAYVGGTAVSDDGSLIYGLGLRGNIYALDPETRTLQFHYKSAVPAPDTSLPRLLAFTDNKLYVNCASEDEANLLGYFDIKSLTWHNNIGIRPRLFDLQYTIGDASSER